jgi:hypothetical protein
MAIARSIKTFGFNAPILVDSKNRVVAGHGRLEAAKRLGLERVPVIRLEHLTEAQAKAYMLADNKLSDRSSWDDLKVAIVLKELSEIALDFDIEATGFEAPEIDLRMPQTNLETLWALLYRGLATCGFWMTIASWAATRSTLGPMKRCSANRRPRAYSPTRHTMSASRATRAGKAERSTVNSPWLPGR